MLDDELVFNVETPLGFWVRTTQSYWETITTIKHPVMRGREADVEKTIGQPDEVRRSRNDANVYLFYRADGAKRWVCAVARRLNGDGFLITAYRTSNIKEGESIWPK